ncbi:hypothetical protein [Cryobacterium zongtaii]|nr:hypothetical protein [Cryobacterium zongtaii]
MASDTGRASSSTPHQAVRADTLGQVEPDRGGEFVVRPYSLTPPELGGLSVAIAGEPTHVLAWVRYPAIADHVRALALAWTPRAVYVEWEDRGTHRAWVWASAVERTSADQEAAAAAPERSRAAVVTAKGTEPLVHLVNAQLALIGAEFVTSMAKPAGPFSAVVFGSIDGHPVRLDFSTDPATGMCTVLLVSKKEVLAEGCPAQTFEEAIESYGWAAAIDLLAPT